MKLLAFILSCIVMSSLSLAQSKSFVYIDAGSELAEERHESLVERINMISMNSDEMIVFISNKRDPFISKEYSTLNSTLEELLDNELSSPLDIVADLERINFLLLEQNFIYDIESGNNCNSFKMYVFIDEENFSYGSFNTDGFVKLLAFSNNLTKCQNHEFIEIVLFDKEGSEKFKNFKYEINNL